MHWSSCNDYAQSQKDLTTIITEYSKGDQLLGNILLALSFLILNRLKILKHFQIPFCLSLLNKSCLLTEYSKEDQLLGNILLAFSFLIIQIEYFQTLKHFHIPFWLSLLNKSCLLTDYVNMVLPELSLYFQLSLSNQSLVNLRLSSTIV